MMALRFTVPIACWRKGHAREFLETEELPPPATVYGALLSLVGEMRRERHIGARVTAGLFNQPDKSQVLRSLWRVKDAKIPAGTGNNVKPDFQQLITNAQVLVVLDSADERQKPTLEERVTNALENPELVERFGGWSLGESTHLINDVQRIDELDSEVTVFLSGGALDLTLPVWVDHVGSEATRYAVGALEQATTLPPRGRVPAISPE